MEVLLAIATSIVSGYIISKLDGIEEKLNELENKLIRFEAKIPKRSTDYGDGT